MPVSKNRERKRYGAASSSSRKLAIVTKAKAPSSPAKGEIISLSKILQRVAYPVEPFRLEIFQNDLPPALLEGSRDSSWKPPDLFDEANDCLANEVQHLHTITRARVHQQNNQCWLLHRVSSRIVARTVAAEVTRRKCFSRRNPPPHVCGYHS